MSNINNPEVTTFLEVLDSLSIEQKATLTKLITDKIVNEATRASLPQGEGRVKITNKRLNSEIIELINK